MPLIVSRPLSTKSICYIVIISSLVLINIYILYTIYILPNLSPPSSSPQPKPSLPYDPPYYGVPYKRIVSSKRKYKSQIVDKYIQLKADTMTDKDLATLLKNCFPNTLDTTIDWYDLNNPYTFLITGDIPAMWIRDSTNQILPYISFIGNDEALKKLLLGVIFTQASFLEYDPYANAFLKPWYAKNAQDHASMGRLLDKVIPQYDAQFVWESKYELDSFGHFFQLSNEYMTATGDVTSVIKNSNWIQAAERVLQVIRQQMKGTWELQNDGLIMKNGKHRIPRPINNTFTPLSKPDPLPIHHGYRFQRWTDRPTETLAGEGLGGVSKSCGLVRSAFRPSDDATTFPYLIPANAQLSVQLKKLGQIIRTSIHKHNYDDQQLDVNTINRLNDIAKRAQSIGDTIHEAIYQHAVIDHAIYGKIFAYEVDCYGSFILMDDGNTPSLLSLPLLGFIQRDDPLYQRTRQFLLSTNNPWYFESQINQLGNNSSTRFQGIGSPHTGYGMIWPMSILVQIQTSTDEDEIKSCLDILKQLAASSTDGYMVESFYKDDLTLFTRPWFSWVNGLFGSMIMDLDTRYPHLL
ncbi:hypothetical protein BJ944DRAFT_265875 [Cunninghamella echinulata]|nr:hypothetical protein BJ944DRAFT_265875 [Cunninghamella echinulata]